MFALHRQLAADTIELGSLPLSLVLLMNNATLPWLVLVPQREEICEWHELASTDQLQLHAESIALGEALMTEFKGHKLNTAALGNLVPQLHIHHVIRYADDPAWPHPVWGNLASRHYRKTELVDRVTQLKRKLDSLKIGFVAA